MDILDLDTRDKGWIEELSPLRETVSHLIEGTLDPLAPELSRQYVATVPLDLN
jgi:hypothetical protein